MTKCKEIDGYPNSKGTTTNAILSTLKDYGICEEYLSPFKGDYNDINNVFQKITNEQLENASKYKSKSYARIGTLTGLKDAIYNNYGAFISINVFSNYDERFDGIIGIPGYNSNINGRHFVFACGYDDDMKEIIIQESDRLSTSANGFRFIPYEAFNTYNKYVDRLINEMGCMSEKIINHVDAPLPKHKKRVVKLVIGSNVMNVNGVDTKLDNPPIVKSGTTLLPFRNLSEALDIYVIYNNVEKSVKATKKDNMVSRVFKNNQPYAYDLTGNIALTGLANAQIINNRFMLPVRLFSESFGAKVEFKNKEIVISI